jgi:hypothetical protein
VEKASRSERLAGFVHHSRALLKAVYPKTNLLLRILDALTADDVEELGKWELDTTKSELIVDRLTAQLEEDRTVLRGILGRCLQHDLWQDSTANHESYKQAYLRSKANESEIEKTLGMPPQAFPYLLHSIVEIWRPTDESRLALMSDDYQWAAICMGYLVTNERAFTSSISLMDCVMRQRWPKWKEFLGLR